MSKIEFKIKWTLRDGSKHESSFTVYMHYQDAETFKDHLWDALNDASSNPDSVTYEILGR